MARGERRTVFSKGRASEANVVQFWHGGRKARYRRALGRVGLLFRKSATLALCNAESVAFASQINSTTSYQTQNPKITHIAFRRASPVRYGSCSRGAPAVRTQTQPRRNVEMDP
eukprot:6196251-Pleurochrysis_carterae.AAC.4